MNNQDQKEKSTYSIPGVIIPAQTTENGQVIESSIVDTSSSINNQDSHSMVATGTEISNVAQVVQSNQIPSTLPQEQLTPPVGMVSSNQDSLSVKASQPVLPTADFKENSSNKQKSNKGKNTGYVLIIILLLFALGFMVYQKYFTPKVEVDPVKEWQRKRVVNTNSLVVQELYNYVNLDGCDSQINFFYGESESVKIVDLSDEVRNYLAYRQLRYNKIEKKNCSNYQSALHQNDSVGLWYCGDGILSNNSGQYHDQDDMTLVISEDSLREQANKMFGEDTYKAKTFTTSNSTRYLYDHKLSSYIYQAFYGENSCKGFSNKLDQAYQQGDDITIVVKVTNNENKSLQMFYYTFTESDDGNYYFKELNKRKI